MSASSKMLNASKIERRTSHRVHLNEIAWVIDPAVGHPNECVLRDLSIGGVLVEISSPIDLPNYLLIKLPGDEKVIECRAVWRSDKFIGIEFL